jgi:predicted MFS family arabinose efflux permease
VSGASGARPTRIGLLLGTLTASSGLSLSAAPIVLGDAANDLGLEASASAWLLAAVSLTLAVTTPLFGRIADLRGLRTVLAIGVALTLSGAVGVLLAGAFWPLLVARLVQGAGAAAVSLAAFSLVASVVDGEARQAALGVLTAESSVALGAGPLIGAAVGTALDWHWAMALPAIGVLAWAPVHRLAPPDAPEEGSLDVRGATLAMLAATALTALLQARSTHLGLAASVVAAVVMVAGSLAVRRHVRRRPGGFLPLELLRNVRYVRLCAVASLMFAGYLGMTFAAPLMLHALRDWSALDIGVVLLPAAICSALTARAIDFLAGRHDGLRVLALFAGLSGAALLVAALGGGSPWCVVVGAVGGICGFAAAQVTVLAAIPSLVDDSVAGVAIGVFNFLFVIGGAVGTALTGALADAASFRAGIAVLAFAPLAAAAVAVSMAPLRRPASALDAVA